MFQWHKGVKKTDESTEKLLKSDPLVVCIIDESGECITAGCGERHVEICLKDLCEECAQCDFGCGDSVVSYRETGVDATTLMCLSKSLKKQYLVQCRETETYGVMRFSVETSALVNERYQSATAWDSELAAEGRDVSASA